MKGFVATAVAIFALSVSGMYSTVYADPDAVDQKMDRIERLEREMDANR